MKREGKSPPFYYALRTRSRGYADTVVVVRRGIDINALHRHGEFHARIEHIAGFARFSERFADRDRVADRDRNFRKIRIDRENAEAMIQNNRFSGAAVFARIHDLSGRRCADRRALRRLDGEISGAVRRAAL